MSPLLLLTLACLVVAALFSLGLTYWRPVRVRRGATVSLAAITLLWLLVGRRLPLELVSVPFGPVAQIRQVRFLVESTGWSMGLYLLLFSLAMLLLSRRITGADGNSLPRPLAHALIMPLLAAGMLSIWAASASALLISWTLLILSWGLFQLSLQVQLGALLRRLATLGTSLLFLTLAGASISLDQQSTTLPLSSWPEPSAFWAVMAAAVMIGTVPFHGWRVRSDKADRALTIMGMLIPWAAAAGLLARLELTNSGSGAILLLATALGVLGLLRGLIVAWDDSSDEARVLEGLTQSQAGYLLLAAAWAGASGVALEIRVAWLALGFMFTLTSGATRSVRGWLRPMAFVAALALLGAPLTAAFSGRAALYDALLDSGGLVLLLVIFLLTAPFGAAALWRTWRSDGAVDQTAKNEGPQQRNESVAALVILVLGLLTAPMAVEAVGAGVILVAITAALLLTGLSKQLQSAEEVLRGAFRLEVRLAAVTVRLQKILRVAGGTLREAEKILETEGGLAWFVVLLIVVLLASQAAS